MKPPEPFDALDAGRRLRCRPPPSRRSVRRPHAAAPSPPRRSACSSRSTRSPPSRRSGRPTGARRAGREPSATAAPPRPRRPGARWCSWRRSSSRRCFTRFARLRGAVLGESDPRRPARGASSTRVVGLPPGVVERAGTGDLVTRTTTDVDRLSWAVRDGRSRDHHRARSPRCSCSSALRADRPRCSPWPGWSPSRRSCSSVRWYFRRAPQAYRARDGRRTPRSTPASPRPSTPGAPSRPTGSGRPGSTAPTRRSSAGCRWERYTLYLRYGVLPRGRDRLRAAAGRGAGPRRLALRRTARSTSRRSPPRCCTPRCSSSRST